MSTLNVKGLRKLGRVLVESLSEKELRDMFYTYAARADQRHADGIFPMLIVSGVKTDIGNSFAMNFEKDEFS